MVPLSSSVSLFHLSTASSTWIKNSYPFTGLLLHTAKINPRKPDFNSFSRVMATTEGSAENQRKSKVKNSDNGENPSVPSWAKPDSEEPPPWARQETQKDSSDFELPFYAYLLASAVTAIAAIGSIFEYVNEKPVFGILNSDSVLYAPVLGFFVFTGIPSSAFLWFKSVEVANKESDEQDRRDGFL